MTTDATSTNLQLQSLVRANGQLELSLVSIPVPDPSPDEVLVRIEASPLNPSDLGLLFGGKDLEGANQTYTYFLVAPQNGTWLVATSAAVRNVAGRSVKDGLLPSVHRKASEAVEPKRLEDTPHGPDPETYFRAIEQFVVAARPRREMRRQRRKRVLVFHDRLARVAERWRHLRAEPLRVLGRQRQRTRGEQQRQNAESDQGHTAFALTL